MGTGWVNSSAAAFLAAAFCFGCGDDGGGSVSDAGPADAGGPDAGFNVGACPTTYGPAAVAQTFAIPAGDIGFDLDGAADLDGDGMVDNALGSDMNLRALINNSLNGSLDDGSLRSMTELRNFTGLGSDDGDIQVVQYGGIDSDTPADSGDDFNGSEDYTFSRRWVETEDCTPVAFFDGSYTGGVITAANDETVFFVASLGGFLDFRLAKLTAAIEADTKGAKSQASMPALFGGAITACSLNTAPGQITANTLEDVVRLFSVQPDIDLDGDGLETIQALPGDGIVSCTDGDGTVIMGELCGCDPRIADGFSITFEMELVGAAVLGPAAE